MAASSIFASAAPASAAGNAAIPTPLAKHPVNSRQCADVETVFARGSGQTVAQDGKEALAFAQEIDLQLARPGLTTNNYELGTYLLDVDGSDGDAGRKVAFPSQSISEAHGKGGWTSVLAKTLSGGAGSSYGDSVDEGVAELARYLEIRTGKCPDSAFVLGGYSQGAQVIGETYVEELSPEIRSKVIFNALFGDPKTYLPEGREEPFTRSPGVALSGTGSTPAMCRGLEVSPYRYNVPNCWTHEGSLNGRTPYLPADWTHKTGLWCNDHDFVCGSGRLGDVLGHGKYISSQILGEPGTSSAVQVNNHNGPIAQAVREIKKRLIAFLPPAKADPLQVDIRASKLGANGLDMVFLVDSTGSMGWNLEQAKAFVATMADRVKAVNGRVALVEYRDAGDDPVSVVRSPLQEDTGDLQIELEKITAGGGGDRAEGVLHGLMTAFNGLDWKYGAAKAAVVLTDAPFHDPDLTDGTTLADVVKRSLEIDPVNVYPVVHNDVADYYQELATATTGKVIADDGDVVAALEKALTSLENRPYAALALMDYYADPGQAVRFDASQSYPLGEATITDYEWDVNADGVYESKTTIPEYTHQYQTAFDGMMQVRITDSNGEISNMSAKVHVGGAPPRVITDPAAELKATVLSTSDGMSTVELSWESSDPRIDFWGVSLEGFVLGRTEGASRSVTVTDVPRDVDTELGVIGATAIGEVGARASVIVPAIADEIAPGSPVVTPVPPTEAETPSAPPPSPAAPTKAEVSVQRLAIPVIASIERSGAGEGTVEIGQKSIAAPLSPPEASFTSEPGSLPIQDAPSKPDPAEARAPDSTLTTAAGGLGLWPWALGALMILLAAVTSILYQRRKSA